jgi:hypothetical protein
MNANLKAVSQRLFSILAMFVIMLAFGATQRAQAQACPAQNWAGSTPNIWAATGSIKVMLNNDATTNRPTIPYYADDGNFNPWGFSQHPQAITDLNPVWSCPVGTPVITVAGAGRETVSFQVFITAGSGSGSALTDVNVTVSPLTGPGTLTSDNTGSSNVTRYLEGYVPYTTPGPTYPAALQTSGQIPDPLIPFYDAYDSGNPAVATPFNVQAGTTQGVWVNISIPANQAAGVYNGTVTVSGNGIGSVSIPVNMTVWNGSLPAFDEGSINSSYADMLKSWLPFYDGNFINGEGLTCDGPGCATGLALFQKYQIMGHNYDVDVQNEGYSLSPISPSISGCYPSGGCTSYTTNGTTSSIDWTAYDAYEGPALTPGGLFSDGTAMRVIDSPLSSGTGAGAWTGGGYSWYENEGGGYTGGPPPAGMLQLENNYAMQISQHFAANHTSKGWSLPELLSYQYDETDNAGHAQLGTDVKIYQNISLINQAINCANSGLPYNCTGSLGTWNPSAMPIHTFLTDMPACAESGDYTWYTDSACADHINLSYPGGTNATAGFANSWVTTWSPNPLIFMPGQPGPAFNSGDTATPTLIAGTGYKYTMDLTNGVPALSTAPTPIERWFYQGGDPFDSEESLSASGVGERINYWIAYKYGMDETVPSAGDASPAPAPGGVWIWVGDDWGSNGSSPYASNPSNCTLGGGSASSPSPSPFVNPNSGNAVIFYPGNEIGCYYTANPVGEAVLTKSPAVNTSCTSNGYSICNGISGPVASMGLEQMRRGYEDYEYLYLLGKQSGRSAAMAIVNSLGGAGMTAGGDGTTSWQALDWENVTGSWYAMGVEPETSAYSGNCTDSTPGIGGLANGLPNGPTGAGSSGPNSNYNPCPGEWTNNPYRFAAARVQLAQALGWASATAPTITSLNPTTGTNSGGTSVVITGTNFTGATEVQFGGVNAASFTVNSATQITAVSPAGSGTVDVQIFGPNGSSQPSSGSQFTFVSPVSVTGLSPSSGVAAGGNSVTITGTDFAAGAVVKFGNNAATNVVVNSATQITATAPAGTGPVYVTVTTSQGTSATNSSNLYTYEPPPAVTGVSPNSGPIPGGTSVTLTGTGFASGMTVDFGSSAATGVTVSSATSATATSPAYSGKSGGTVDVTVTTTDGTSTINGGDHFTYTSPVTVTALSVKTGPPAGGTSVVITGTDFTGATAVKFGGNAASFTVNSATQITATSPAGGGTVDITVTTPSYNSAPTFADQFSYTSAVTGGTFAILPTTAVGSASSTQNVSITLQSATAISSITVPPAQNGVQEFTVGTVTGCTVGGGSNPANTVCTVPIAFHPQYPGVRMGAIQVNNNGTVIGTAGVAGVGQGPELAQTPGALAMAIGGGTQGVTATPQSVTSAALSVSNNGSAFAMDGAGNLYIADDINCMAYKVTAATSQIVTIAGDYTFSGKGVTPSTTPEPALGANVCPQAIGVDGAGNVYLVDSKVLNTGGYPYEVDEVSAATGEIFVMAGGGSNAPSTTPQAATSVKLNGVNSVATDSAGNLYIADFFNNLVEKVTPAGQLTIFAGGGSTAPSTTPEAATSAALNGPTGMVMDAAGNFYLSDQNISVIDKVSSSGQITTVAGGGSNAPSTSPQSALSVALNNPASLAVDGAGDLYIADFSNNLVERLNTGGQLAVIAGGGSTIPTATPQPSTSAQLGNIQGVEVDGAGNLYIADGQNIGNNNNMVEKVSTTIAPLSFPYTNVGQTSAAQSMNVMDIGNQTLTFNSVSATTDFPLQSGGTCTMTSSSGQTLASGVSCSLKYAFAPTQGGVLNESATLSDNALNVSNATQGIPLTGTGIGLTPQLTAISPSTGGSGTSVTVTGTNLSGATEMNFGSSSVTPTSSTSTSVTAIAPAGSGTVTVTVTTTGGTSNGESFTYTSSPAATPTFSPAAGTYTSAQTVTISDATSGATIYYTTNGSTPTTSSTVYSGPISVSTTETVKAIATASGYTTSAVGSATYTINLPAAATPTFSPAAGTYASAQTVTISDSTSGATIYYTTDGSTPTTSSSVYSSAISVSTTETIKAIATASGHSQSAVGSAAYTISGGSGSYPITDAFSGTGALSSNWTNTSASGYVALAQASGKVVPSVASDEGLATYTGATFTSDQYSQAVFVTHVGSGNDTGLCVRMDTSGNGVCWYPDDNAVGRIINGAWSNGVGPSGTCPVPASGDTVKLSVVGQAYTCTDVTTGATASGSDNNPSAGNPGVKVDQRNSTAYALASFQADCIPTCGGSTAAATPTFSPAAGTYTSTQSVTISDSTSGATIYYTTNGSTPTTSSSVYSSPISVSTSETIKAIATATGYTQSAVGSAAYTINPPAATPTFSPAAGTYTSAQTVTISDSTSGATIYYTTNGSTPTTSSSVYSSPISVSTSETIKAIATASGYSQSAVGSAAYTISSGGGSVITTIAGVQGGTSNPTSGTVAHGNDIGAPYGVAVAPVLNGAGGDVYFDNSNGGVYVIYKGGAAAKAILAADSITSPVTGDVYTLNLGLNETGPYQPKGLFVDSYGNLLIADPGYNRVYMLYAGTVSGQGTNPADALLNADPSAGVGPYYGLHAGYLYHVADGGSVVGSAPVTPLPKDVWVDGSENVFFTDGAGNGLVEAVYNTTGTSAHAILTAEGYTSLKQGYTYIIAGGQSVSTYPNDNDGGSSVAYNGATSTANTALNNPWGIYGDSAGDLIFADNSSNKIKKLSGTTAVLTTIGGPAAGTATTVGHGGDGGPATSAQMNAPIGVILDASGNVYFADSGNSSVRMINTSGTISTVAGTSGTSGAYTGEGGPATSAVMNTTYFPYVDASGNLYIADSGNDMIHVF